MRIVGGIWKGRVIDAPGGRETRPTTDRTRESIASSILSFFDLSLEEVRVLDAFAGSGAFGIEMLSRGAKSCVFIDDNRRAALTVRNNLALLHASRSTYRVLCADAFKSAPALSAQGAVFEVVFLDPPYATSVESLSRFVESLLDARRITGDGIVVYERSAAAATLDVPRLELVRTKKLGETAIDYFTIGAEDGV